MAEEGNYTTNSEWEAKEIQAAFGRFEEYKEKAELLDWMAENEVGVTCDGTNDVAVWVWVPPDGEKQALQRVEDPDYLTALRKAKQREEST